MIALAGLSYGSALPSCVTVDDKPLGSSQGSEGYQLPLSSWWGRLGGSSVVLTLCAGTEFLGWTPDLQYFLKKVLKIFSNKVTTERMKCNYQNFSSGSVFYHNLESVTMRLYVVTLKNFVAFWVARKQWPLDRIRGYLD